MHTKGKRVSLLRSRARSQNHPCIHPSKRASHDPKKSRERNRGAHTLNKRVYVRSRCRRRLEQQEEEEEEGERLNLSHFLELRIRSGQLAPFQFLLHSLLLDFFFLLVKTIELNSLLDRFGLTKPFRSIPVSTSFASEISKKTRAFRSSSVLFQGFRRKKNSQLKWVFL